MGDGKMSCCGQDGTKLGIPVNRVCGGLFFREWAMGCKLVSWSGKLLSVPIALKI